MIEKNNTSLNTSNKASVKFGLTLSIVFFCLYLLERIYQISVSTRSMALPGGIAQILVFGIPLALAVFLLGWSLAYIYHWLRFKTQAKRNLLLTASLVLLLSFGGLTRLIYYSYLCSKATASDSANKLLILSKSSLATPHSSLCSLIIENVHFDIQLAVKMRKASQCYLDSYLASNPNTPAEILVELSQEKFCPHNTLKLLLKNKQLPIEAKETIYKNCPETNI